MKSTKQLVMNPSSLRDRTIVEHVTLSVRMILWNLPHATPIANVIDRIYAQVRENT